MTKFLIVSANFYEDLAAQLEAGAKAALAQAGVEWDVVHVAGALEIPPAIAMAAATKKYAGYVALGCVIRGETYHFEVVSNESARGIMALATTYRLPIGNGILTVDNEVQARVRTDIAQLNKGGAAARAALQMLTLKTTLES